MMTLEEFILSISNVKWFSKCGIENPGYIVLHSIFEAYDNWNEKYLHTWEPQIHQLEAKAIIQMGDEMIDKVYSDISSAMNDILWDKWGDFIARQDLYEECGLEAEVLDMVKRDLSWAFIEQYLHYNGFFSDVLLIYKEGYFPCSWEGFYPSGKAVVL